MISTSNSPRFRFTLACDLLGTRRLRYDPVGWDTLGISLHRDLKTHGVATEYSVQLSFVKDGRYYLKRAYDAAGIEANVSCLIEQYDPNAFAWLPYYQGRVNFLAAEFSLTQAKVNVEQGGWLQRFLSRDTVKVDLLAGSSVSGSAGPTPTPLQVQLHSRAILQRYAASQKASAITSAQMFGDEGNASHEQVFYVGFDTPELNELGLGAVAGGFVAGDAKGAAPIYRAKENGTFTLEFALRARVEAHTASSGPDFENVDRAWHFRVNGDPTTATRLLPDFSSGGYHGDFGEDVVIPAFSVTLTLQVGDGIYLYGDYFIHGIGGAGTSVRYQATITATILPGSYLRITATTTTAATPTTGLLLYEACQRLTQALTDQPDVFRSSFLGRTDTLPAYPADGPGSLVLLTSGFQVRGFPLLTAPAPAAGTTDSRKTLSTTWQEAFGSLAAAYNLGWGLEWVPGLRGGSSQVVRVEDYAHFYPATIVLDLLAAGPVALKHKVDAAAHYQIAEMGYDTWQAEQANGLDEFNAKRQWTTPLTQVQSTYSQVSKLVASGILLETSRRERYDATATTDNRNDATNFLVCLLRTPIGGYETERNQQATALTGVLSPTTVYNLRLSPARMLRRHGAVLRAGLLPLPGTAVRFTTGTGNNAMLSQLTGEPAAVAEGSNVTVSSLAAPLWLPGQYTFTAPVSRAQLGALLALPTGRVRFVDDRNVTREGWVLDFKHNAKDQTADFTLLPCATSF